MKGIHHAIRLEENILLSLHMMWKEVGTKGWMGRSIVIAEAYLSHTASFPDSITILRRAFEGQKRQPALWTSQGRGEKAEATILRATTAWIIANKGGISSVVGHPRLS